MVSILLATTGRADMASESVKGLFAATAGHDIEVIAAVDSDEETRGRLAALGCIVDYSEEYRGPSRAWNAALARAQGDPVVLAADDLVWSEGWLDAALATLADFEDGWGFVGFNDGHWTSELSTHYLASRRLIVEAFGGVIAWECYRHSFNDVEASKRARRAERYAWCEGARVGHRHWTYGERPQDATDARALAAYDESARTYQERESADFPNDYEPVIS